MAQVSLRLPGTYNVLNSLAVSYFSELVVFSCALLLSRDCYCLSYFTHDFIVWKFNLLSIYGYD
jgi:hypothetical protein